MDKLWKTRTPPVPMMIEECLQSTDESSDSNDGGSSSYLPDQRVCTVKESIETFIHW